MKSRIVAIGSWLLISALIGCGDDSSSPSDTDAGPDGGGNVSGSGGGGGKGGTGGQSTGGKGGQSAGGVGGENAGGSGGQGGNGGTGGTSAMTYTIGGQVEGLTGTGLVLVLNDFNDLSVASSASTFTFEQELEKGETYRVSVKTQPTNPLQACAVMDGEGTVGEEDVTNVKISCSNVQRSIGGNITGLGGGQIVLKNNNGNDLTVTQDGTFTFTTLLAPGADYAVTIATPPSGRTCSLTKATGTVAGNNITDVTIACYEGLTLSARARPGSVGLTWNDNGATSYTVYASTENCNFDDPGSCAGAVMKADVKSPYAWLDLNNGQVYYFSIRGSHPDNFTTRSTNVAGARPNEAAFDGPVNALARGGDGTIYAGGAFNSVGAFTGPMIAVDKTTGLPSRLPGFHVFPGGANTISAIVPDGSGGYYVAGRFDLVLSDTNTIHNLAHVTNTGAVDPAWKPEPGPIDMGVTVRAIALQGTTLYLAGNFTTVGMAARPGGLAAVSTTGAGDPTSWNPTVTPVSAVDAVKATATTVYVAGRFTAIGANNATRAALAALDATSGDATAWNPNPRIGPDPSINIGALALDTDTVYVAGDFDMIGGAARSRLAALSLSTGDATAFTATPTSGFPPNSLAVSGNVLYVGGNFTDIGGTMRNHLAALDKGTGAVQSWDPGADGEVQELAASGDLIYVAGDFQNVGMKARKYVAAIDKNGALVESWDPRPSAALRTIAADGDTVYMAGNAVVTYGADQYAKLAAFKGSSLTTWSAAVSGGDVLALAISGTNIYFGGSFNKVGTADRNGLAVLSDAAALGTWDAHLSSGASVHALAASNNTVYAGGDFTVSDRANLVALSTTDATIPSGWMFTGTTGGGTSAVQALALANTVLYVGGDFGSASGSSRSRLAAVDSSTGEVVSGWNPGAGGGSVRALAVVDNVVFAGGDFTTLGANPHPALGAIDATSGAVDSWEPAVASDPDVRALAAGPGNALYAGGTFSTDGPMPNNNHQGFVGFDTATTGYPVIPGTPDTSGTGVFAIVPGDGTNIYLGGNFVSVGVSRCTDFCAISFMPPL